MGVMSFHGDAVTIIAAGGCIRERFWAFAAVRCRCWDREGILWIMSQMVDTILLVGYYSL
jgi:hypothetical protein